MDAAYTVVVNNASEVDKLTLNSLNDDKFRQPDVGARRRRRDDLLGAPDDRLQQQLHLHVQGPHHGRRLQITHKNVVTADVTDDDNKNSKPTDDATVVLTTTP